MTAVAPEVDTARDCPACPQCHAAVGTPANIECGVGHGRWYGPNDATIKCVACGTGWVGSDFEVAQAWRAWCGLTNSERELLERLADDIEAGT